jgi:hypothetical protein
MVAAGLLLLIGCGAPTPEPASAEAVESAVTEAESHLEATDGKSGHRAGAAADARTEGKTT